MILALLNFKMFHVVLSTLCFIILISSLRQGGAQCFKIAMTNLMIRDYALNGFLEYFLLLQVSEGPGHCYDPSLESDLKTTMNLRCPSSTQRELYLMYKLLGHVGHLLPPTIS